MSNCKCFKGKMSIRGIRCGVEEKRLQWGGYMMHMDEESCINKCQLLNGDGMNGAK